MDFAQLKEDLYHKITTTPTSPRFDPALVSDIVLHLPVLEYYASLCDSVVEFGVREANSTVALIAGCKGKVDSFDIQRSPEVGILEGMTLPCSSWTFHLLDTGSPEVVDQVPEADLLFIDTLHTYNHVIQELRLHGHKARRFIAFHDTFTCGEQDLSGPNPSARGIVPAIEEYLAWNPGQFETVYRTDACNGLWILKRC